MKIRIVDFGVREVIVQVIQVFDTDDGLSNSVEYYDTFTNATDKDTDNDGLRGLQRGGRWPSLVR